MMRIHRAKHYYQNIKPGIFCLFTYWALITTYHSIINSIAHSDEAPFLSGVGISIAICPLSGQEARISESTRYLMPRGFFRDLFDEHGRC